MSDSVPQYPVYKAVQVANKFIELGREDGIADLTNMKLQKLVFFAHSVMLGDYARPLIEENFRAWEHGPIVYELYAEIRNICDKRNWERKHCFAEKIPGETTPITDKDALKAISDTWKVCKNTSAGTLGKMTHLPGSPWSMSSLHAIIPNETIRDYMTRPSKN